jgi:HemY protein
MIRLIVFLIVAIGLSLVAVWFANNPGEVQVTWLGQQVQTSVGPVVFGILAFAVVFTFLFELFRMVRGAPRKIVRNHRAKRQERGYQALTRGLVAAAAGDRAAARQSTKRAEKLLDKAPTTLLLGAQAAQLEGRDGEARVKFEEMLKHPETEFLGLRGLLAQAIKDEDPDAAYDIAKKAYRRHPETPWVLTTLFELQTQGGHWQEALTTVGDMARHKLIDRDTATRRRAILFHQQSREKVDANRLNEALDLGRKAHKLLPGFAPIAVHASGIALKLEKTRLARKIIETAWKVQPHPLLAKAMTALDAERSPTERLRTFERLQSLHSGSLEGELALAEQAIAAEQWPAARDALHRAIRLGPTASAFRLMAEVERATDGDADKIQKWLAKAVDAPPDPAWLCKATGEAQAEWAAFGPDGKFDSLHWGQPPRITPLLREDAPAELILPNSTRNVPARRDAEISVAPKRPPDEVDAA